MIDLRHLLTLLLALGLAGCGHEVRTTTYGNGQVWSEVRFKDGVPDGVWRTFYENGKPKSEGSYKNGAVHGIWRTWFEDGADWSEQFFIAGKPEGDWKYYYESGLLHIEGSYEYGRKVGPWFEYYGDGTLKNELEFVAGVQCCQQTNYYPNGNPAAQLQYDDEGQVKFHVLWTEDGRKFEGPIVNDKKNGRWTATNPDGTVNADFSGMYENDVKVGE